MIFVWCLRICSNDPFPILPDDRRSIMKLQGSRKHWRNLETFLTNDNIRQRITVYGVHSSISDPDFIILKLDYREKESCCGLWYCNNRRIHVVCTILFLVLRQAKLYVVKVKAAEHSSRLWSRDAFRYISFRLFDKTCASSASAMMFSLPFPPGQGFWNTQNIFSMIFTISEDMRSPVWAHPYRTRFKHS